MSAFRLLSFCPDLSTSKGTWPKRGGVHLKALYKAICMGVEGIHSYSYLAKVHRTGMKGSLFPE